MSRFVYAIATIFTFMAISTAHAQPAACKKVDVSFACRNGGSGTATYNCRGGETKAQCCARIRKRAAHPRRGFCTGRAGGLISFRCGCSKKGGGGVIRRDGPAGLAGKRAPTERAGAKGGNVEFEWKVEEGEAATAGPHLRTRRPMGAGPGRCRHVAYAFSCRRGGGASGKANCRRGEGKAACCKRIAGLARESCARKGGVGRFRCDCAPGVKGATLGGLKKRDALSGEGLRGGMHRGTRAGQRKACSAVQFNYSCKGQRREGGRQCRRNETEAECCSYAFSLESRKCGGAPRRWKCRCVGNSSRGGDNRLKRIERDR